ncbi:hypothetical protein [Massilia cavernae]|uniref:N-acetyltransferase domain-containing protein n=1 Tax=Massilia cavernae TaxID=2320864 RepID=A0A418Y8C1_9BURK|nr:hypothetical protein [Massilia cavernae]RJG27447.1 hypothetical protein D3872_00915 [Massilia cavernae]
MDHNLPVFSRPSGIAPDAIAGMKTERLPFTIKRVRTEEELMKAVQIRHAAYARHLPEFARTLALPEECDFDSDAVILLAESKLDGSPIGSARIQTNFLQPLHVEESVELPLWLMTRRLAEVTRLGIDEGRIGRVVKVALIKACFEYCERNKVEWAVVTGRAPIDRQYEQLLFADVFPGGEHIPLRHVGNMPHRVMAFEIETGEERWTAAKHPMLGFFRHTHHPDIDVGAPAFPELGQPALLRAGTPPLFAAAEKAFA